MAAIEGIEHVQQYDKMRDADEGLTEAEKQMKDEELSFYSNSENSHGDDNIWGLLSGISGNIYEWYDFAVYGLLAPEIGLSFFPEASPELQLINSFGVYLAAFLMRPLGALFFGEIGDRMVGRKNALVFSLVLITVPSILMGLLPTYNTWGIAAPILLIILRLFQGLSVGGQLAGSYVLSIEQSAPHSRGFRGSVCDASSIAGFLLASLVTTITRSILTEGQVDDWGWRCPFLFSLILAPLLYYVVRNTEESKHWESRKEEKGTEEMIRENEAKDRPAIVDLLKSPFRRRQLAGMIGVLSALSSSFYILFLWTPVYLSHLREIISEQTAGLINVVVIGCYICFLLLSGKMSDTFQHRKGMMTIGIPGIIIVAPTMFAMFETESVAGVVAAQLCYGACLSMVQGSLAAWKVELWMDDPSLSYTAVAVGHNVSSMIFGGTLPLMATYLFYRSESFEATEHGAIWPRMLPGVYISCLGLLSFYCISAVVKHPHDVRTGSQELQEQVARENLKYQEAKKKKKQASGEQDYAPPSAVV